MSNPAVIYLSDFKLSTGENVRVEDNIGEAIHIHIGEYRFDFTIDELIELSKGLNDALENLIELPQFRIEDYDSIFLSEVGSDILYLTDMCLKEVRIGDLLVRFQSNNGFYKDGFIDNSRVFKYLNGNQKEIDRTNQENYLLVTNETRIKMINESIKENGYPHNNQHLILFNNQLYIRDGQHRGAVLASLYGLDQMIEVKFFYFLENKGNIEKISIYRQFPRIVKNNLILFLKRTYRFSRRVARKIL